jgi:sigma-54 interacting transcriptional regulator/FHA domain-containing protein
MKLTFRLHSRGASLRADVPDTCRIHVRRADDHEPLRLVRQAGDVFVLHVHASAISKEHASLWVDRGEVSVEDGSRNGTFVRVPPGVRSPLVSREVLFSSDLHLEVEPALDLPQETPTRGVSALRDYIEARLRSLGVGASVELAEGERVRGGRAKAEGDAPGASLAIPIGGEQALVIDWKGATAFDNFEAWVREVAGLYQLGERAPSATWRGHRFTAESKARREARRLAMIVAASTRLLPVLMVGPTGSGKGELVRDLCDSAIVHGRPLLYINVAALTPTLLESELFGHARGAFTGAGADKPGLLEQANGGTLFLDEIGDLALELQPKLLDFLQSGTFRRVGELRERSARVRVLAATQPSLFEKIRQGQFREDLYYRLAGLRIDVPALEPADIRAIVAAEIEAVGPTLALPAEEVAAVLEIAARLAWQGGARELVHAIERYLWVFRDEGDVERSFLRAYENSRFISTHPATPVGSNVPDSPAGSTNPDASKGPGAPNAGRAGWPSGGPATGAPAAFTPEAVEAWQEGVFQLGFLACALEARSFKELGARFGKSHQWARDVFTELGLASKDLRSPRIAERLAAAREALRPLAAALGATLDPAGPL